MIFEAPLIDRIESSAARVTLEQAAAYRTLAADDPAEAVPFGAGALAAFGPGRPVNRAVGVSLADLGDAQLDELEAFYEKRGLPASLEVAAWAPMPLVHRLAARGYALASFRNVYVAELRGDPVHPHPAMTVREVTDATLGDWLGVLRAGHEFTTPEAAATSDAFARAVHQLPGATDYLAEVDGVPSGCGSLTREGGIGWLGGAATVPGGRRRGIQGALVRHRMAAAFASGCDVAVSTAVPAGSSARNLARLGFTLAYCQAVLTRPV